MLTGKEVASENKKRLVLGCGALVYDLLRLIKQNPSFSDKVNLQCLPAGWHNSPQLIAPGVEDYLSKNAHLYEEVYIAYADFGTAHCYEFFAGKDVFDRLSEEEIGTFYLTDYLVKNFNRIMIKGLGLDKHPELFEVYFEHYKKLVYLAQTENEQWNKDAEKYAKDFGFEYEYRLVGTGSLDSVFEEIDIQPLSS